MIYCVILGFLGGGWLISKVKIFVLRIFRLEVENLSLVISPCLHTYSKPMHIRIGHNNSTRLIEISEIPLLLFQNCHIAHETLGNKDSIPRG